MSNDIPKLRMAAPDSAEQIARRSHLHLVTARQVEREPRLED